jgi:hypothetical protein
MGEGMEINPNLANGNDRENALFRGVLYFLSHEGNGIARTALFSDPVFFHAAGGKKTVRKDSSLLGPLIFLTEGKMEY